MSSSPEYAPEYTRRERARIAGALVFACVVIYGLSEYWFRPALSEFAATAHCRSVLGMRGSSLLFYGFFVGFPLLLCIITFATLGRRGIAVLRSGQEPPPGQKVFRPTPIRRGKPARRIGLFNVFAALPFLAIAFWGYFQANEILS